MDEVKPLSEKSAGEIEALARQISVAHRLDAEIQAELRGHVEDKVRGYVNGEVRVSEADALLLAKAHFGEAEVIRGMFRRVHGAAHAVSLGRRLAAAVVASQVVVMVMASLNVLRTLLIDYPVAHFAEETQSRSILGGPILFEFFFSALAVLVLWRIFAFWRKREREGRRLWFEAYSIVGMIVVVICAYVLTDVLSSFLRPTSWFIFSPTMQHYEQATFAVQMGGQYFFAFWLFSRCCTGATALLWIWWVDGEPRTRRAQVYTLIFWLAQSPVWLVFLALWSSVSSSVSMGRLVSPRLGGLLPQLFASFRLTFRADLLVGLLVLVVYWSVTRSRRALGLR
jgi:hypothetical protein